jgi:hypothetical protein
MIVLFVSVLVVLALIFGPQITIWTLNTLFHLEIPITLATWFAMLWLCLVLNGANGSKS